MNFEVNEQELKSKAEKLNTPIEQGENLFYLYSCYFNNENKNPKGKQSATDFTARLFLTFKHAETGKLLKVLDNGQDIAFFRTNIYLYSVGALYNLIEYGNMMAIIAQKKKKIYHSLEKGKMVFTSHKDGGVLGMPVRLSVVHVTVPVMKAKDGAEKNQYGRYNDEDLEQKISEDGTPETRIEERIVCTRAESESWEDRIMSGFPVLGKLTEEEAKLRDDDHWKPEEEIEPDTTPEQREAEEKLDW